MPEPSNYETEKEWMAACVPTRIDEGDEQDQAVAVCLNIWRRHTGQEKAVNLERYVQRIRSAWYAQFGQAEESVYEADVPSERWVTSVFDDAVIVQFDGQLFRVPYSEKDDQIVFIPRAEWEQVRLDYVPAKAFVMAVKATDEWTLDILGVPFGSPQDRDLDGEWFDADTKFHDDKFGLPPLVYYHGWDAKGLPDGAPTYLGRTVKRWVTDAGVWFRGVLDQGVDKARDVWAAAQKGAAAASSGAVQHLARVDKTGHIREWPVGELSIFDVGEGRRPVNRYAVALPVMKAMYERAGIDLPDDIAPDSEPAPEAAPEAADTAAAAAAGAGRVRMIQLKNRLLEE